MPETSSKLEPKVRWPVVEGIVFATVCVGAFWVGRLSSPNRSLGDPAPIGQRGDPTVFRQPHRFQQLQSKGPETIFTNVPQAPGPITSPELDRELMRPLIAEMTKQEAADYAPLLEELGLSSEELAAHTRRIHNIHELANAAQSALLDLSQQRVSHDRTMRKILSPEDYAKYLDHEKMKPVKLEMQAINSFLQKREVSPSDYSDTITQAVLNFNAITTEATHGPYDPAPRPTANGAEHLPHLRSKIERIQQAGTAALQSLSQDLPPEVVQILGEYYNQRLAEFVSSADFISNHLSLSPEERMALGETGRQSIEAGTTILPPP